MYQVWSKSINWIRHALRCPCSIFISSDNHQLHSRLLLFSFVIVIYMHRGYLFMFCYFYLEHEIRMSHDYGRCRNGKDRLKQKSLGRGDPKWVRKDKVKRSRKILTQWEVEHTCFLIKHWLQLMTGCFHSRSNVRRTQIPPSPKNNQSF
jgi:hypothetical protein